jgi:AraC-like DNA-binding protein
MKTSFIRATLKENNRETWTMIVKTRRRSNGVSYSTPAGSRGVRRLPPEYAGLRVSRHNPSSALAPFIAYYWMVSWDLQGRPPHLQETLPHPNVYLVFENNRLTLGGVSTSKFTRMLAGKDFAFGVKFRPGGARPFLNSSASSLTDRIVAPNYIFGADGDALEAALVSCCGVDAMVHAVEAFFLPRVAEPDENVQLADRLVGQILYQPQIRTVDDLADQTGIGKRSLQRLFREYVGIPPKWVIRRYRLHELIERLEAGDPLNWCDLALELGYFDQAHLIHDFRAITGYSPADYQRR